MRLAASALAAWPRSCAPAAGQARCRRRGEPRRRGLAEPLADRELEMLRLIAAGRSNQGIAHDLVVALDTVKSM
jgi:ATP/maltotriose-dependent transcriptional regulator MalT